MTGDRRLAALTGVAVGPIRQWGFVERVSDGLLCLQVGLEGAHEILAVADAWASRSPLRRRGWPKHTASRLQIAGASLLALVPALAGMAPGGWLRARARPETFRLCFFVGLPVLGGELVRRGLA